MKKLVCSLLAIGILAMAALLPVQPAMAAGGNNCRPDGFLGIRPWWALLPGAGSCEIETPNEQNMAEFVWKIGLVLLSDLFVIVAYLAIGFMIYGGWWYLRSEGDPNNVAKGKKILVSAAIGAAIAILATVIVNTIIAVLGTATS